MGDGPVTRPAGGQARHDVPEPDGLSYGLGLVLRPLASGL